MLRDVLGAWGRRRSTGASSFHLIWEMPGEEGSPSRLSRVRRRLVEVSAVLEVLAPPRDQALYFWALQVDLADDRGVWGGAHTGLQWNQRYPQGKAVNWGGYCPEGGHLLTGTISALPGFPDDPNTVFYPWRAGRPYRLRVYASPEQEEAWRAEVTDLESGESTPIRDLLPPSGRGRSGSRLLRPMVWTEVFADCDAPSVTARWSDLQARDENGASVRPLDVRVNYQSLAEGGCPNTTVLEEKAGVFLQVTNAARVVPQGARLPVFPAE